MPLAPDFHRGLPPRQDPELEAREIETALMAAHPAVKYRPSIFIIAQKLHRATTRPQGCVHRKIKDRNPRRPAGPLFYPGVYYKA
jgi:hypothetical protein